MVFWRNWGHHNFLLRFSDLYQMLMIILDDNLIFYIFSGHYNILVTNKVKKLIVVSTLPFKPKCQSLIYNPKLALIGAYVCYSFPFFTTCQRCLLSLRTFQKRSTCHSIWSMQKRINLSMTKLPYNEIRVCHKSIMHSVWKTRCHGKNSIWDY